MRDEDATLCLVLAASALAFTAATIITAYNIYHPKPKPRFQVRQTYKRYRGPGTAIQGSANYMAPVEQITEKSLGCADFVPAIVYGLLVAGCIVGVGLFGDGWKSCNDDLDGFYDEAGKLNKDLADLNSWAVTENLTPPVAGFLNFTTHEGCAVNDYLNGSSVYDSPLGYNITIQPLNGKLSLDPGIPGVFVYKSNPGFIGNDTFSYIVNDLDLGLVSNVANVTITVNPDKPPVAGNMTVYTAINNSYNGYLDGFDPDNDTIHYSTVSDPLYGTLKLGDDGFFVYTPADNFTGNDSFTYQTTDNVLNSTVGNVTICVVESKTPIAYNMIFNIAQNSLLNNKFNITGTEGNKTFNLLSKPAHGILNILGESFTYKPFTNYNGQDRITYNFTDVLKQTSNLQQSTYS